VVIRSFIYSIKKNTTEGRGKRERIENALEIDESEI